MGTAGWLRAAAMTTLCGVPAGGCTGVESAIGTTQTGRNQPDGARRTDAGSGVQANDADATRDGVSPTGFDANTTGAAEPDTAAPLPGDAGERDVFNPPVVYDGPAPPPECVAPCIWDIVKHCVPELGACVGSGDREPGFERCDADTGWRVTLHALASAGVFYDVSWRGERCYGARLSGGRVPGGVTWFYSDWGDATTFQGPGDTVLVRCENTTNISNDPPPDFVIDPTLPQCAAWDEFGLPVAARCASVTEGECGDDAIGE